MGARRLRNTCLGYLSKLGEDETTSLCLDQFRAAGCMTDSVGALVSLASLPGAARDEALDSFYAKAKVRSLSLTLSLTLTLTLSLTPTLTLTSTRRPTRSWSSTSGSRCRRSPRRPMSSRASRSC